jgi:hypothetical protein
MPHYTLINVVAIGLVLVAPLLQADVVMKQVRRTDPFTVMGQVRPAKTETTTTWLGEGRVRIDRDGGTTTLVDYGKGVGYMLDHRSQSYVEMPLDVQKAIDHQLAKAGPKVRQDYQAVQGTATAMMRMEAKVTPTDETRRIGDWTARKYLIETSMGTAATKNESWATEDIAADMSAYWKAVNASLASQPSFAQMLQEMAKIKGVVVLSVTQADVTGIQMKTTEELVDFAEKAAPSGTYDLPAGYRNIEGIAITP